MTMFAVPHKRSALINDSLSQQTPLKKSVIRYETIYHLLKIRNFTKNHIIRLVYQNEKNQMISVDGLYLKFPSALLEDSPTNYHYEVIYVYFSSLADPERSVLRRSDCELCKNVISQEWTILSEKILSVIPTRQIHNIVALYQSFVPCPEKFNLTYLRKLASCKKNCLNNMIDMDMQDDYCSTSFENKGGMEMNFPSSSFTTTHRVQLQIYSKNVVVSYKQIDKVSGVVRLCDFLVKQDILAYTDFLQATQLVLSLLQENGQFLNTFSCNNTLQTSLSKLSRISDQLAVTSYKNENNVASASSQRKRKIGIVEKDTDVDTLYISDKCNDLNEQTPPLDFVQYLLKY